MKEFERALQECLDDLAEGRRDVDACLERYPHLAEQLRPRLLAAAALRDAFGARPREDFARAARERFLFAAGQGLRRAYDVEPSPSFFAAARIKFLMTAHRMRLGERTRRPRRLPLFGTPFRALAGGMAALALFLGASTYTVASANNSLPGDWQYGVKLQTERVRLALAFTEDAKRDVRLGIAAERADEIQRLAEKGRPIGESELERLRKQTEPLVAAANENKLDADDVEKLNSVTAKQKQVLAEIDGSVRPEAREELAQVVDLSERGYRVTVRLLAESSEDPLVITPSDPVETATPEPTDTPEPSATPSAGPSTPGPETPDPGSPTVGPTQPPPTPGLSVDPEPRDSLFGVQWVRLAAGSITTLIPSEQDGWQIMGVNRTDGTSPSPLLVRLSNVDGTSLITLNTRNGDMYWFILRNGRFDEIQMRITRDGRAFRIDRDALREAYGTAAEIPIYVLDHIEIVPPPPTPEPSPTAPAE